jgi:hypothetical protein
MMQDSLLRAGLFGEDQCCKIKMPGGFVCGRLIIEHPTSSQGSALFQLLPAFYIHTFHTSFIKAQSNFVLIMFGRSFIVICSG